MTEKIAFLSKKQPKKRVSFTIKTKDGKWKRTTFLARR